MKEDIITKTDMLTDTVTAIENNITEMTETTETKETLTKTDITV